MSKSLPPFVTIPRPVKAVWTGRKGSRDADRYHVSIRTRMACTDETELVRRAAQLCNCSMSEFLRQAALNICYALGVERDDRAD